MTGIQSAGKTFIGRAPFTAQTNNSASVHSEVGVVVLCPDSALRPMR